MGDFSTENPRAETNLRSGFDSLLSLYLPPRLLGGDGGAGDSDLALMSVEKHFVLVDVADYGLPCLVS